MSFQPVIPFAGFAGWSFLKRTMAKQAATLAATPSAQRDEDYFRAKIGTVKTAEALVADRRLLSVSLAAFGLEADINNKAFIRKILEGGTLKPEALANRLADKQYQKFAAAFGFGDFPVSRNQLSDFADKTLAQYRSRQFEAAVGQQNGAYRLALNAERELPVLAARGISEDAKWFTVMGNRPLRQLFQTALGLPQSFASIDLDQQLGVLKTRMEAQFGSPDLGQFTDPAKLDRLVRTFLTRDEMGVAAAPGGAASAALQLLQSARR